MSRVLELSVLSNGDAASVGAASMSRLLAADETRHETASVGGLLRGREHDRVPTQIRAVLYLRQRFQSTTIRDISLGGVRLDGAVGLMPGDEVKVVLMTGHSKAGVVRWWLKGSCGVSFLTELESGDSFLQSAIRNVRKTCDTEAA